MDQPSRTRRTESVGNLADHGVSLSAIFGRTAVAGGRTAVLSFAVARREPSPQRLHPRATGHMQSAI
jgi:hypothetical protein